MFDTMVMRGLVFCCCWTSVALATTQIDLSLVAVDGPLVFGSSSLLPRLQVKEELAVGPLVSGSLWILSLPSNVTSTACPTLGSLPTPPHKTSSLIALYEIHPNCSSLVSQLTLLLNSQTVHGILLYGNLSARSGDQDRRVISTFNRPILLLSREDALALSALPKHLDSMPSNVTSMKEFDLQVTLSPRDPDFDPNGDSLFRFFLSLLSILLCTSFLISVLMNYYFYEAQQRRQRDAERVEFLLQLESGLVMGHGIEATRHLGLVSTKKLLSQSDLERFTVWEFSRDAIALEKKKRQQSFKALAKTKPKELATRESLLSLAPSLRSNFTDSRDICPVCLEDFEERDLVREMDCSHWFHAKCIDQWVTTICANCPMCKKEFTCTPTTDEDDNVSPSSTSQSLEPVSQLAHPPTTL